MRAACAFRGSSRTDLHLPHLTPALGRAQARKRIVSVTAAGNGDVDCSRRNILAFTAGVTAISLAAGAHAEPTSIYDFTVEQYGQPVSMSKYRGKNVNYQGFKYLLDKYNAEGLTAIAFPCNQFGAQAPETSEGERRILYNKMGYSETGNDDVFPVMDKIEVNGPGADPLYAFLKNKQPQSVPGSRFNINSDVAWNYEKFLVDRNGIPIKRYKSPFNPADFEGDVRLALAGKAPLPEECFLHPGRSVCKVEKYLE